MSNLVSIQNREVVTSSLQVAEKFEKRHDNVMQAVENLRGDVLNFKEIFYETYEADSMNRDKRVFLMNRDGFTLLVMGFTGSKARKFQQEYIAEFNRMEKALNEALEKEIERQKDSYQIEDPIKRAEAWIVEEEERQKLKEENEEMKPKAEFTDRVLDSPELLTVTQISKDYGMSAKTFNKMLKDAGVQYKQGKQWFLYSKYQNNGYTKSSTHEENGRSHPLTKWTEKGRQFLYEFLKEEKDLLPTDPEEYRTELRVIN